jgi:hypothetical protein
MKILYISIFLLFPLINLCSQSNFKSEIGAGFTSNLMNINELRYWDKGYIVIINNCLSLNSTLDLTQTFSYQNYSFNNSSYSLGLVLPAIYGIKYGETHGERSQLYEISIGIRSYTPLFFFKTFASVRAGAIFIDQGAINTSVEISGNGESRIMIYKEGDGQNIRGLASVGLGSVFMLSENFNLILEGKITTTFSDLVINTSVTSNLQYGF